MMDPVAVPVGLAVSLVEDGRGGEVNYLAKPFTLR